jgi:hypothetical protein
MALPFPYYSRSVLLLIGLEAASCLLPLPTLVAQGQLANATIAGRVIDHTSRAPIPGARVFLLGTPHRTGSDVTGRFTQDSLASGTYLLQVRAVGYSIGTWVVRLEGGDVVDQDFEIAPLAIGMDPVTVEGRPGFMQQRMIDFNRRRESGRGVFITEEEIRRENAATLSDLLRTAAGVQTVCNGTGCIVRMSRSSRGACRPDFMVDGFPATFSTTWTLPTVGIVAVEIYRSQTETPAEFTRAGAMCGVIVIWTRSAPNP